MKRFRNIILISTGVLIVIVAIASILMANTSCDFVNSLSSNACELAQIDLIVLLIGSPLAVVGIIISLLVYFRDKS
jgi:hypothetical protein